MTKLLTVQNAEITTATVEIKTLTVSGKQVTLAVFRQLRRKQIIDKRGQFRGIPWGTVNYHPGQECSDYGEHLHVVWQEGSELRRACERPLDRYERFYGEHADDFVIAAGTFKPEQYGRPGEMHWVQPDWVEFHSYHKDFSFTTRGLRCVANVHGQDRTVERHSQLDLQQTRALFAAEVEAELERRDQTERRWEELKALPQLFIAV